MNILRTAIGASERVGLARVGIKAKMNPRRMSWTTRMPIMGLPYLDSRSFSFSMPRQTSVELKDKQLPIMMLSLGFAPMYAPTARVDMTVTMKITTELATLTAQTRSILGKENSSPRQNMIKTIPKPLAIVSTYL